MQTVPADIRPVVRAAVVALDSFGAMDRETASNLLDRWARRFQLSNTEIDQVLDHYPLADPAGFHYSREMDDTAPEPVPPYVQGAPLGRGADW